MRSLATLLFTLPLLTACAVLPSGSPRESPPSRGATPSQSLPQPYLPNVDARQCLADLQRAGVNYTPLPDRTIAPGCTNLATVQLLGVPSDTASLAIANLGPVTCAVSQAFASWVRFGVDRAARQVLGSPLRSIETFGSYSCRNVAGSGRRSAHASAEAIDVSAFVLEDGRRISVEGGWNGGNGEEQTFLRLVHESACKRFDTVLGPEYNRAHHDHVHVEGVGAGNAYCR